ncbi:hypothetical protein ACQ4LE_003933 [Meloidogyne hapla]
MQLHLLEANNVTNVVYDIPKECVWQNLWVFWTFISYLLLMAILLFIFLITCCFVAVKKTDGIIVQDKRLTKQSTISSTPPNIKLSKKKQSPLKNVKKEESNKNKKKEEKHQKLNKIPTTNLETAAYLTQTFHPIPLKPKGTQTSQEQFIPESILVERQTSEEKTPI